MGQILPVLKTDYLKLLRFLKSQQGPFKLLALKNPEQSSLSHLHAIDRNEKKNHKITIYLEYAVNFYVLMLILWEYIIPEFVGKLEKKLCFLTVIHVSIWVLHSNFFQKFRFRFSRARCRNIVLTTDLIRYIGYMLRKQWYIIFSTGRICLTVITRVINQNIMEWNN